MKKSELEFLSADKRTKIHAIKWEPETDVRGILQISHGMVEYVERYENFAEFLTKKGIMVVGNDHLGHGESVNSSDLWGYFAPQHGSDVLVEDMEFLRNIIQREYAGVPYFMLGHSMGSFLLRKYLSKHGEGLQGAIVMGTGSQSNISIVLGKSVCKFLALFRGWKYRSKFVNMMVMSGHNKRFREEHLENAWLTKDKTIVENYNKNPKCTFCFTLNGFYNLFDMVAYVNRRENINAIPKKLPLMLVSGEDDPVGGYGEGVRSVYEAYKKAGIQNITFRLFQGDRHEILNELDKEQVYEEIYDWIYESMQS